MPTEKADVFTVAKFGNLDTFKRKFNKNEINKKAENGASLLHKAIAGEKFDIALFLLHNGIDVNLQDKDGGTALHYICEYPNKEVAEELLQRGGDINIRDKHGNNAMWTAVLDCKDLDYEMVELFIKYKPDILTKNNAGRSSLDFAKQAGYEKLINLFSNYIDEQKDKH